MAPVRLRHPKGVTTIQVDFTNSTVQDLQQEIFAATEIPPSQQERTWSIPRSVLWFLTLAYPHNEVKAGYPPHPLTLVTELPIDSLGLKQGEQLVVTQRHASGHQAFQAAPSTAFPAPSPAAAMTGLTASQTSDSPRTPAPTATSANKGGQDYVLTSNGYLMHRVSAYRFR